MIAARIETLAPRNRSRDPLTRTLRQPDDTPGSSIGTYPFSEAWIILLSILYLVASSGPGSRFTADLTADRSST